MVGGPQGVEQTICKEFRMARVAGLDVAGIVAAALAVADREGLDKLTMRRLSTELEVTPMAAYHHVSGKEELLDLVIDESIGQLSLADPDGDPLTELAAWFDALHDMLMDHPALAQAMAGRRLEGPQAVRAARSITACAQTAGLEVDLAIELVVNAFGFTLGSGLYATSRDAVQAQKGDRDLAGLGADGPMLATLASARTDPSQFRNGLKRLLQSYLKE
jgi:AcrR family transcriptional regulator